LDRDRRLDNVSNDSIEEGAALESVAGRYSVTDESVACRAPLGHQRGSGVGDEG
jgi:hypothetical protein